MKTRAKQVVIDIVCPCSHLSLYTDCSLTSTLVLFLPAELQGRDEMSLTIREKVASLKEKVAGLERDVIGFEAIVNNLDHLQCRTEGQLRRIIDAASVDEPFYPGG